MSDGQDVADVLRTLSEWVNHSRLRSISFKSDHAVAIDWTGFEFSVIANGRDLTSLADAIRRYHQ